MRNGLMEKGSGRYCQSSFQPSKFSGPLRPFCSDPAASGGAVTITIGGRFATDAVYRQGAWKRAAMRAEHPGYWTQWREHNPARAERNRQRQRQRTSKGGNAVCQHNSALDLATTAQLSRKPLNLKHRLLLPTTALWSKGRLLPHKGKRAMLTTDQINDLHHLYWAERWPIRKIEQHLRMSGGPSRNIWRRRRRRRRRGPASANWIPSSPPSPNCWRRTPAPARPSSSNACGPRLRWRPLHPA